MKSLRVFIVMLALALAAPCLLSAAPLPAEWEAAFKPLDGVVIGREGEEWLLDLGREQGVHEGDLFSLVEPGPPVVNPQTGEGLGRLLRIKGLLQVIWVQPRFSQVRRISGTGTVATGAPVRRFEGLTATFIDETGTGEQLYLQLRDTLTQLRWIGYRSGSGTPVASDASQLSFILTAHGLKVLGPDQQPLRHYPTAGSSAQAPQQLAAPVVPTKTAAVPDSSAARYRDLGKLPGVALIASFVRQGDRLLLAISDGNGWQILDVGHGSAVVVHSTSSVPTLPGKVLSLHWWHPQAQGPLYLAVTLQMEENAAGSLDLGKRLESTLFRLNKDQPVRVLSRLADMVGTFDLDGDGRPETLLGQDLDRDIVFGGRIRQYRPAGEGVEATRADLSLPLGFPVLGGALCRWGEPNGLTPVWVKSRTLYISPKGKSPYQMPYDMGGSLLAFSYDVNSSAANRMFKTVALEVSPICADLSGDGRSQLVTVASEISLLHLFGVQPGIKKSWLEAVTDTDGHYRHQKLGPDLDAAIQGLAWDQGRLLLVATYRDEDNGSHLMMLENGKSGGGK